MLVLALLYRCLPSCNFTLQSFFFPYTSLHIQSMMCIVVPSKTIDKKRCPKLFIIDFSGQITPIFYLTNLQGSLEIGISEKKQIHQTNHKITHQIPTTVGLSLHLGFSKTLIHGEQTRRATMLVPACQAQAISAAHHMRCSVSEVIKTTTFSSAEIRRSEHRPGFWSKKTAPSGLEVLPFCRF